MLNFEFEFEKIIFEKVFEKMESLNPRELRLVDIENDMIGDLLTDLEIINCDKEIFIKKVKILQKSHFLIFFSEL